MRFLLDECITEPVAKALIAVGCPAAWSVDLVGKGAPDDAVYNYAAAHKAAVVTQDRGMGTDKVKQQIVLGAGCGVFVLRRPKVDSSRLKLIRILTVWEEIERLHGSLKPPFIYECRATGLKLTRIR